MAICRSLPVSELMYFSYIQFVQMTRHVCLCWTKKTGFFIIKVGAIWYGEMLGKRDALSLPVSLFRVSTSLSVPKFDETSVYTIILFVHNTNMSACVGWIFLPHKCFSQKNGKVLKYRDGIFNKCPFQSKSFDDPKHG